MGCRDECVGMSHTPPPIQDEIPEKSLIQSQPHLNRQEDSNKKGKKAGNVQLNKKENLDYSAVKTVPF